MGTTYWSIGFLCYWKFCFPLFTSVEPSSWILCIFWDCERRMGKGLNHKISVMAHAVDPFHMRWKVLFDMFCYIIFHSLPIMTSNDNHNKEKNYGLYENRKNLQNLNIKSNNNKKLQTLKTKVNENRNNENL